MHSWAVQGSKQTAYKGPSPARHLYVSPATAKTHVARLLMKLNARDPAQLIVIAYESGLVTSGAGAS
jgi:hypothetical protein